ncbi:unnamed protein product [Trichogramma brassicae]|uniref:Nose resistant-to-fluoxetine protein N-terminal domain-containing protein n=1 Tax=Trichogramma brassicae TaxID=86971 RepID=A0A6H5IJ19_9HYME|nr:unnamed protein product [Trichogramma brassicae]
MLILNCISAISLVLVLNANESLGHLSPFHRVAGLDRRALERNRTARGYLKLTDVRTAESCDEGTASCPTTVNTYVNYVESDLRDFPRERSPFERIWLEKIPLPPIAVAESRSTPKGACRRQLSRYFEDLRDGKLWAVQMFDASAKYPYGIIDGQTRHLGSFDQCYRVDTWLAPATKYERLPERVRGRYCLVDFEYKQKRDRPRGRNGQKLGFDFNPKGSAWEAVKEKGDFRRVRRYNVQMALCVPAACSPGEVSQALSAPYADFAAQNELEIRVRIDEHNCQTQAEEPRVSRGTLVYGLVLGGIVVTVVISSIYDGTLETQEEREGSSNAQKLLLCFSARRNLRTVFEVSYKHRGLDTIHFLRFVSMCMVLIGHRMMQYYFNPVVNKRYLEMTFDVPSFVIVHNGPIIVDGFFAIGGLLTCYGLLDQFDKTKRMNFIGLTFIRFLRYFIFSIIFDRKLVHVCEIFIFVSSPIHQIHASLRTDDLLHRLRVSASGLGSRVGAKSRRRVAALRLDLVGQSLLSQQLPDHGSNDTSENERLSHRGDSGRDSLRLSEGILAHIEGMGSIDNRKNCPTNIPMTFMHDTHLTPGLLQDAIFRTSLSDELLLAVVRFSFLRPERQSQLAGDGPLREPSQGHLRRQLLLHYFAHRDERRSERLLQIFDARLVSAAGSAHLQRLPVARRHTDLSHGHGPNRPHVHHQQHALGFRAGRRLFVLAGAADRDRYRGAVPQNGEALHHEADDEEERSFDFQRRVAGLQHTRTMFRDEGRLLIRSLLMDSHYEI